MREGVTMTTTDHDGTNVLPFQTGHPAQRDPALARIEAYWTEIRAGRLTFGTRSRRALRIVHAPDADTLQTIYLAFDDPVALRRVWDDLILDAAGLGRER